MTQYIGTARHQNGQKVAVSGVSASFTNPIGSGVIKAMIGATLDICFRQGVGAQTALVTDPPVFASEALYITVASGETIAVIARDGASTGSAYICEAV